MRTVTILAFLALVALSFAAIGAEPVSVGGDFGAAWLKNLPYQPTAATDEKDGLWSWGGTPRWMTIANGTLEKVNQSSNAVDYLYPGTYGSSGHSDDPWIEAQLTGKVQTTLLSQMIRYNHTSDGWVGFLGLPLPPWYS
jgi:hypothetical protein